VLVQVEAAQQASAGQRGEAEALAAIERDTRNMAQQRDVKKGYKKSHLSFPFLKAFERDTKAINDRVNAVERLVADDLRTMERRRGAF